MFHGTCPRSKWLVIALLFHALPVHARTLEIPLWLDQGFMQRLLAEQVYTDDNGAAQVWDDGRNCNRLMLSGPELDIVDGKVRTRTAARASIGTVLAGICFSIIDWDGYIEVFQEPVLSDMPGMVEFRVVDSGIYKLDGESRGVIGTLWRWIKGYVHPRFDRLQLDLDPVLNDLRKLIGLVFPHAGSLTHPEPETVSFADVAVINDRIKLDIRFEIPRQKITIEPSAPEPALTDMELAHWEEMWQQWDAFLTMLIKYTGVETNLHEVRSALLAVLLDARQDIIEILVPPEYEAQDPLPALFAKTWGQLAPIMRQISAGLPVRSVINYLGFITAADALAAIATTADEYGLHLDSDVLRHMARMLAPAYIGDPLQYDLEVDPEIRALFGFSAELSSPVIDNLPVETGYIEPGDIELSGWPPAFLHYAGLPGALLLPIMIAANNPYEVLVTRLNDWIPGIMDLNQYLPQMQLLLDYIVNAALQERQLDAPFRDLYRPLVLTTAWQESCWRQHIKVKGEIRPILSHAGAVGIMQVNQHVWRGFYAIDGLRNNVGYNARAGSEIVYHYLVDYAIAKGEHNLPGATTDNLARATYAMYNGGPRQINRYRRADTSASLRAIDNAFWKKFQVIRTGDILAVAECYSG